MQLYKGFLFSAVQRIPTVCNPEMDQRWTKTEELWAASGDATMMVGSIRRRCRMSSARAIRWFCVTCRREFSAPPGDAPRCHQCARQGTKANVVTRCHNCSRVVRQTEGTACLPCAADLRRRTRRLQPDDVRLTTREFAERWHERWGDDAWSEKDHQRIADLCHDHEASHLKSAVHSNRDLDAIDHWCSDLRAGRNPGGGITEGGFTDYGALRCPTCGKTGGCRHRKGGGL
jgi:hypothetical protein